jgi:hypothetical protein
MGRNFLQLCNEVLDIMFYTPAETFSDLDTTEGRLVKTKMNNVLREVCSGEQSIWKFREKKQPMFLIDEISEYKLPNGYILHIRPNDGSNRPPLVYNDNYDYLPTTSTGTPIQYWIYGDKINLYPTPSKDQDGIEYTIDYLTNDFAYDEDGTPKPVMEVETDEPIIPEIYRSLLVYGTAKNFRASRGDAKSEFYKDEYNRIYNDMLYNQRLTEDYIKGSKVLDFPMSNLQSYLMSFYNPYIGKKVQ